VLISSEPGNDEASAAALILLQKIKGPLMHSVPEGVRIIDEHVTDAKGAERALKAVEGSLAVLFLLSSGTLASPEQMKAIVRVMASAADESNVPHDPKDPNDVPDEQMKAIVTVVASADESNVPHDPKDPNDVPDEQMTAIGGVMASADESKVPDDPKDPNDVPNEASLGPAVVLMTLPGFEFPSDEYYSSTLPRTLGLSSSHGDLSAAQEKVRYFFKRIAIHFPTGAADNLLENQAAEVVSRLKKRSTTIHRLSPSSYSQIETPETGAERDDLTC